MASASQPKIVVNIDMSLRDYFAAMALQGILANVWRGTGATPKEISEDCYKISDAMIRQSEKK